MAKIIGSPTRYIQGRGELANLAKHAGAIGETMFILVDKFVKPLVMPSIEAGMGDRKFEVVEFGGECSMTEINRVIEVLKEKGGDVVVGIGGGKTHDTAKAVGYYTGHPVVIVPTIASTDAPCSALSVIYTDEGVFEKYLFLPSNPNIVLVDTDIVSKAPARLLAAGIGDALATYFEARACAQSQAGNCVGGKPTKTALALAKLCYETLLEDGVAAYLAVQNKVCTKAVENIIEANTYLSGIGFESGGLAAAHAVHNGLTAIEATHKFYHGEKVAFGVLVQLVLENAPKEEIEEVVTLCQEVGLPTTLADLDVTEIKPEEIMAVAETVCAPGDTVGNMPFEVTPEDVYAAILAANEIGEYLK